MSKISDAQDILSVLGLPPAQQNEISALTLLALCGLKEKDNWANATRTSLKISKDIMAFVNKHYKKRTTVCPPIHGKLSDGRYFISSYKHVS
ncbi:hypothetical protein NXW94_00750 [Bacteroides ovatus]|nr:hypothetical protein [Bacteroides ovatus]